MACATASTKERRTVFDMSYAHAVRLQAIVQEIVPDGCPNG
jgi:hypothetical protein